MNTLGTIKQFEDLIHQGFGYAQLLDKLNLTEDNLADLVTEYPAFALVIKARYGITIEPKQTTPKKVEQPKEEPKETKPLKNKAKSKSKKDDDAE